MKRLILIALSTFFLCGLASAQLPQISPFSADLQISSTRSDTGPRDITGQVYIGDGHIRMNMETAGHQTALITDLATSTTDVLLPEQQMYVEHKAGQMPGRGPDRMTEDLKPYDPDNPCGTQPDLTCKKIGVEEVSGRTCDHWEVTNKQEKVSNLWIDQKLHFPVKVTSQDASMLLTNIKEGQPDATLFQIPPGFHKIDMGNMMPPAMGRPPQN